MSKATQLKRIVARRDAVIVPGAANALSARVIEDLGFEVVYLTGAGFANTSLGVPDIGLTTITEVTAMTAMIADAVDLPIIVDADTGFGNPLNMVRTVKMLERAGAAGLQIEDQVFPKKCGHFSGKGVVPLSEMLDKLKAALDTRTDPDLQIIARTDAAAIEGLDRAIERAQAFAEVGADLTFVEAPRSFEELAKITHELKTPQVANIVFGGKTPDPGNARLSEMGFSIVLYANAALQASVRAHYEVLGALKRDGSLDAVAHRLASFDERQRVVAKHTWDALEEQYSASRIKGAAE
ncbi:carboxyvinyl-carboxyphosphonate phosphorylmutase [Rhizobium sp. Leaf321]|jgi:2-methylisocitrate lyase-like PEP mutase family enzyme|uniref:isocitrate lyase/PEP mutase family protein n=1 Tax=Rhizobium sp. Leaf321 TaxID=1736335 RepID=UPI0007137006|nr:oxaloacetate decarboxylase [Rhizobium sp. Leaf321]KQQ74858.1 carboxyvinyl-carboxyphosphonate phosphorylmutase [Rhizobium sp. Leaf321]